MANGKKVLYQAILDGWIDQHADDIGVLTDSMESVAATDKEMEVWIGMQTLYRKMVDDAEALLATLPG